MLVSYSLFEMTLTNFWGKELILINYTTLNVVANLLLLSSHN